MTPLQSFPSVIVFCTAGNKVAPDSTHNSIGFQPQEQLPAEYHNYMMNVLTSGLSTAIAGLNNITSELDNLVSFNGVSPSISSTTQVVSGIINQYYDLYINSNAALMQWVNCTNGSLRRVYVASGVWTASNLSSTAGVLINLDLTGTTYVFAEKGSSINYSGSYAGNIFGLYHASATTDMSVERFDNVKVIVTNSGGSSYGFNNCTNLTNCTGTGGGTGGSAVGFNNCTNLTNCTGTGSGTGAIGFNNCTNLTNCTGTGSGGGGVGFNVCTNLTNCTGTGTGAGSGGNGFSSCTGIILCAGKGLDSGAGTGYGFYGCHKMQQNKASGASKTATYNTSYADSGVGNACADTAAGGYNS